MSSQARWGEGRGGDAAHTRPVCDSNGNANRTFLVLVYLVLCFQIVYFGRESSYHPIASTTRARAFRASLAGRADTARSLQCVFSGNRCAHAKQSAPRKNKKTKQNSVHNNRSDTLVLKTQMWRLGEGMGECVLLRLEPATAIVFGSPTTMRPVRYPHAAPPSAASSVLGAACTSRGEHSRTRRRRRRSASSAWKSAESTASSAAGAEVMIGGRVEEEEAPLGEERELDPPRNVRICGRGVAGETP